MISNPLQIAVVIAAYNAEATIARSVQSALAANHVAEIIVIDDASDDATATVAREAGLGDPRLQVLRYNTNRGPSAARNRAIAETQAPLIAILDADDFFLPDRFERILAEDDWDLCGDNIVFVEDPSELDGFDVDANGLTPTKPATQIDFQRFVRGNISHRKRVRGELGFLKPVIRREFLIRHAISYDENCRLGEDFIFYSQALALGARMKVVPSCGYAALVRPNSLSSRHRIEDLEALYQGSCDILASLALTEPDRHALQMLANSIQRKIRHREVLQVRSQKGLVAGFLAGLGKPSALFDIAAERILQPQQRQSTPRLLMNDQSLAEHTR